MNLRTRSLPFEVPKYSLTGDILSFRRCGLQYRYYNGSSLPPSRPVQLWTGEFIHGVLEEAYLYWDRNRPPFPWPCNPTPWPPPQIQQARLPYDVGVLGDRVEARLRAAGKIPRNTAARIAAYRRVDAALNILAPHLFPLIDSTEEKISGTRDMPPVQGGQTPRGDRYELVGVVDVISQVSLVQQRGNPLVEMIVQAVPYLSGQFDIIVDYKAARRPPMVTMSGTTPYWNLEARQVQTYAWLRAQQPGANPVGAGILVYVNELSPSESDLLAFKEEISQGRTDIQPASGTQDYYTLYTWQRGMPIPVFSEEFLLHRAVRIVEVTPNEVNQAVQQIDHVVSEIELCALNENVSGVIISNWPTTGDDQDCDACDFRRFCPSPARSRGGANRRIGPPVAPG